MEDKLDEEEENRVIGIWKTPEDIVHEYSMDTWIDSIYHLTFETQSIPLTVAEIKAVCSAIKSSWRGQNFTLTEQDRLYIENLSKKIDSILQPMQHGFIKLSTRSPKDSVFENSHPIVEKYLLEELSSLKTTKNLSDIDTNDELLAFTRAANKTMRVSTAKEALDLICVSERVYTDLNKTLQRLSAEKEGIDDNADSSVKLIIRKWEEIPIDMEFRGFVCKGKLNGLSQYFHYLYFTSLIEKKEEIVRRIRECWDSVKDKISHESYVIDFCITSNDVVKIIEINPFHFSTGAPFFGWKKGTEGRSILLNGPFEFRLRLEKPTAELREHYLITYYSKFIDKVLDRDIPPKNPEEESPNNESGTICVVQ